MGSPKLSYASTSGRVRIGAEDCLVGDNTLSSLSLLPHRCQCPLRTQTVRCCEAMPSAFS